MKNKEFYLFYIMKITGCIITLLIFNFLFMIILNIIFERLFTLLGILPFMNTFTYIFSLIIFFIIVPGVYLHMKKDFNLEGIKLKWNTSRYSLIIKFIALSLYLLIFIRLILVSDVTDAINSILLFSFIGISEEILIRGYIYYELRKNCSTLWTVIISSLIFAFFMHTAGGSMPNLVIRFPISLVLTYAAIFTKDIYTSILLHSAYDMAIISLAI